MGRYLLKVKRFLLVLAALLFCLLPAGGRAEAVDAWGAAAQALGVYAAYQSTLKSMLSIGNDVNAQISCRRQDWKENGRDQNRLDHEVVDRVMNRLVHDGDYALRVNSLPFLWTVNDSALFNASCYPTNYISINRGLVRGLNCDEDELAAVLAHEMTHGLEQHSARNYAQAVAQYLGISFLSMAADQVDWNKMAGLVNYSIAKNVTLPTEYEADEGGFYLMTSAGFNPGGAPAAMARMGYYLRYTTTDIWEYDAPDKRPQENTYNDHPETGLREKRLAEMMTEYSCGHVTVENGRDVCIDGQVFFSAEPSREDYDNQTENAYYIAGGIAKAFHDHDDAETWNFRKTAAGRDDLLTDAHAYRVLRETVTQKKIGARLQELVSAAYAGEAASQAREKQRQAEEARLLSLQQRQEEALQAEEKYVKKLRENGDAYSDYGMGDYALMELSRSFACRNQDDLAESYAIRGRAKAVNGDFDGALQDVDRAVSMDAENPYNFLNRADVYHMQGDFGKALMDVAAALELDRKNWIAFRMQGDLQDELGRQAEAEESYRSCYALTGKSRSIPMEYLERIDRSAAEKLKKAAEEERKKADQAKEKKENESSAEK